MAIDSSKLTLKGKNTKDTKSAKTTSVTSTSSVENKEKITIDKKQPDPKADGVPIEGNQNIKPGLHQMLCHIWFVRI